MLRVPIAALAIVVLAVSGCGSEAEDREDVESVVRDYYAGFATGDADKACDQLSTQVKDALTETAKAKDCQEAILKARQAPDVKKYLPRLRDARVESVMVDGGSATAKVSAIGQQTEVTLVKEGDDWKIEGPIDDTAGE
jgi:hypothetical protein